MRRVAGFDMGVTNYAVVVIDHCPAERRRNTKKRAREGDATPLAPEQTRLVGAAFWNWKADAPMVLYDATLPPAERIQTPRVPDWEDVTGVTLCRRTSRWLANWAPLHTVDARGELPLVVIEQPGAAPSRDAGSINNHLALRDTVAAITGADEARGRERSMITRAKKADVRRGTAYEEHKAESVASCRAHATKTRDAGMLAVLRALDEKAAAPKPKPRPKRLPEYKLDDVSDAYNLARAHDRRTIRQLQQDLARETGGALTDLVTNSSEDEEDEADARPAKRRRLMIDLTTPFSQL
jgi:hypothetical protein